MVGVGGGCVGCMFLKKVGDEKRKGGGYQKGDADTSFGNMRLLSKLHDF